MAEQSIISPTAVIRGNVRGHGSLRVEGRVRGNIEVSGDLVIGPDAEVQGNVIGASVTIAGAVVGDATGSDAVLLDSSARVVGDLRAPRVGIAEGASVRGSVATDDSPAPAPRQLARPVASARPMPKPIARPRPMPAPVAEKAPAPVAVVPAKKVVAKRVAPAPVIKAPSRLSKGRKKKTSGR